MFKPYSKAEISFQKGEEIGLEGSNSKAYRAHDLQLDAEIVIKEIPKNTLDASEYFEESSILYLSSHPNVVPVHYACEDPDNIFIAMPYYKEGSLNRLLDAQSLTVREIIVMGCQIASGLHNVHSKKLIHFDVKPGNVLLSDRGEAMVSDFGLSRRMSAAGLAGQDRMYFKMKPPESYGSSEFTLRFDIYQFGLTLYRMCNGNARFDHQFDQYGTSTATFNRDLFKFDVCNGRFPDRNAFLEHIPARMQRIINKCLATDPADRPEAAIEVANELAQVDERFDWRYSDDGSERVWIWSDGTRKRRLVVKANGESHAEKIMTATGRSTRIAEFCKQRITSQEIRRFLGNT